MDQTNPFLMLIPRQYISALLKLHKELEGKNIDWVLSGDLGEALKTVRVEPDCIEIVTSKLGAEQIHEIMTEFGPNSIEYRVQRLSRDAVIKEKEYPVYMRSYNFEFYVDSIKVKIYGYLQFKINDWDWGETFEFNPDVVYVVDKKTLVVPLSIKLELYQRLGWADQAEKINWLILNQQLLSRRLR